MHTSTESIYRIDKFSVPRESIEPFLERLREAHQFLDTLEGCIQNRILQLDSGTSHFNIMTLVEWRDVDSFERAKTRAMERHAASGVRPQELFKELGVEADLGNYKVVPH